MPLIGICRCLCALFLMFLAINLCMTVAPGGETWVLIVRTIAVILAVVAGIAAIWLQRLFNTNPNHGIFTSKMVAGAAGALALVIACLGMLFLVG